MTRGGRKVGCWRKRCQNMLTRTARRRSNGGERTRLTRTSLTISGLEQRTKKVQSCLLCDPSVSLSSLCLFPINIIMPSTPSCPLCCPRASSSSVLRSVYVRGYRSSRAAANSAIRVAVVEVRHMGQLDSMCARSATGSKSGLKSPRSRLSEEGMMLVKEDASAHCTKHEAQRTWLQPVLTGS
jgi:hypothetical protein